MQLDRLLSKIVLGTTFVASVASGLSGCSARMIPDFLMTNRVPVPFSTMPRSEYYEELDRVDKLLKEYRAARGTPREVVTFPNTAGWELCSHVRGALAPCSHISRGYEDSRTGRRQQEGACIELLTSGEFDEYLHNPHQRRAMLGLVCDMRSKDPLARGVAKEFASRAHKDSSKDYGVYAIHASGFPRIQVIGGTKTPGVNDSQEGYRIVFDEEIKLGSSINQIFQAAENAAESCISYNQ